MQNRCLNFGLVLLVAVSLTGCGRDKPKTANEWVDKGFYAFGKKNYNEAVKCYTRAIELNPNDPYTHYLRGMMYEGKGNLDKVFYSFAISDYEQAIKIKPDFTQAYYNRGMVYYYQKNYAKAWEDVRKAQSLGYEPIPSFLDYLRKASGQSK
ncbi:MAG: tetratricopeptide repeat protein [Candidatus Omnitrophota bacterium]